MIDPILFRVEFDIFENRFNRTLSDAVRDRYYEILSEHLDDERFRIACYQVFQTEDYFPSPQKIIEASPTILAMIGAELERLKINAVLLPGWTDQGKLLVSDLDETAAKDYLTHLRGLGTEGTKRLKSGNDTGS